MENTYWVPDETMSYYFNTLSGTSKNKEWMQILGVPCILIKKTNKSTLHSFCSAQKKTFDVDLDYFNKHFKQIEPIKNYLNLEHYPFPVNIT